MTAFRSRLTGPKGALTALGVSVVAFLGTWEGLRYNAYQDIVGVWTICYGETKGVKPGDKATKAECDTQLLHTLANDYEPGVAKCIGYQRATEVPNGLYLSMVEGAYNYGVGAFCKSTAAQRVREGDFAGACEALTWFNKAGGSVVRGLVNRRKAAHEICRGDLPGIEPKKLTRSRTALDVAPVKPQAIKTCVLFWCW